METKTKEGQRIAPEKNEVEFPNLFYLKGLKLEPVKTDEENALKIMQADLKERKFRTSGDLGGIILSNGKQLFGEGTCLLDCAEQNSIIFSDDFIPHGLLFDARDKEKPILYFIEVQLAKETYGLLFARMTSIFHFFRKSANLNLFAGTLENAIRRNIGWRNKLKPLLEGKSLTDFLTQVLLRKPEIILALDADKPELIPYVETYSETWGKMIKPIICKKADIGEDTLFTMTPCFAEIGKTPPRKPADKKVKTTEDDHLDGISEQVKEIYQYLKAELLKADSTLEFRVKGHYISLRKDRNLAFFQLGRKKLTIVLANPEKDMREQLFHHEVRTLAESVKKFWNGNEDCFTVVIEKKENLDEVLSLLKKLAGVKVINGNEPKSQEESGGEKMRKEAPKMKKQVKGDKSDKKSKSKKK